MSRFPFGEPAARRPPRPAASPPAALFVLGVYPSALHIEWTPPSGRSIKALAVADEPKVFWDGAGAGTLVGDWKAAIGWSPEWGTATAAPPRFNGSSGRSVVEHVLDPLGVMPEQTYFTDCLPTFFIKSDKGSQGAAIEKVYAPFAKDNGLPETCLQPRPTPSKLVAKTLDEEAENLRTQIEEARAPEIVTLGQEAADVLAKLAGIKPRKLKADSGYGNERVVEVAGVPMRWWPLTHPGNRVADWRTAHADWVRARG